MQVICGLDPYGGRGQSRDRPRGGLGEERLRGARDLAGVGAAGAELEIIRTASSLAGLVLIGEAGHSSAVHWVASK